MKLLISEFAWLDLDAPTLPAIECFSLKTRASAWLVFCKYCGVYHRHGPQEGHREAHCPSGEGYSATGYNLVNALE